MPYRRTEAVIERLEEKRTGILKAAIEQAEKVGLDALNVRDVAERGDIAVGTIYLHYPNLTELVAGVVAHRLAADLTAMRQAAQSHPLAALAGAMSVYVHRLRKPLRLAPSLTRNPSYRLAIIRELDRLIAATIAARQIAPINAAMGATAAYGLLNAVTLAGHLGAPTQKNEPALIAMALRAIGVGSEAARELAAARASVAA